MDSEYATGLTNDKWATQVPGTLELTLTSTWACSNGSGQVSSWIYWHPYVCGLTDAHLSHDASTTSVNFLVNIFEYIPGNVLRGYYYGMHGDKYAKDCRIQFSSRRPLIGLETYLWERRGRNGICWEIGPEGPVRIDQYMNWWGDGIEGTHVPRTWDVFGLSESSVSSTIRFAHKALDSIIWLYALQKQGEVPHVQITCRNDEKES